jgi:hypothetical protein
MLGRQTYMISQLYIRSFSVVCVVYIVLMKQNSRLPETTLSTIHIHIYHICYIYSTKHSLSSLKFILR